MDETGKFYKLLLEKMLVFKRDTCSDSKRTKKRITVSLGANTTGSNKLPHLILANKKKTPGAARIKMNDKEMGC